MAYSDFTLDSALRSLELTLREREDIFADVDGVEVEPSLRAIMDENTSLAMAIHTEKARSELIVRSGHQVIDNADAFREVIRILHLEESR